MEDKRKTKTVLDNANSIYAAQAGEGPGTDSEGFTKGNEFEGASEGRQDGRATIKSHPLTKSEGMPKSPEKITAVLDD